MDFTILDSFTIVPPYHGTTNNDGVVVEPDFFEKVIVHLLTLIFPTTEEDLSFLKDNLIILDYLMIMRYPNPSKIFSKIVLCQAAGIYIDCEITMEELKALINPDFATSLFLGDRVYYSNTNALVFPEEIFGLGPKLNSIHYVFLNK